MLRISFFCLGPVLLAAALWQPVLAADWPQWRGPNRDGIAVLAGRLLPWPVSGPPSLWTGANSSNVWIGNGYSSLAVSEGRLFTLGNSNDIDRVYCLDAATGNILWTNAYSCPRDANQYNGGPSATPTVEGGVVFTLSKFGHLFCFNVVNGHTNWQRNLIDDFGVEKPEWGFAGSPVIEGDMLLLNAGGHGMALNKHTGVLIWLSNTNRAGYSSIVPFNLNGTNAGVFLSYTNAYCVALTDGQLIWSKFWRAVLDVNIPDPIVAGDRIFLTGYNKPARIVRADDGQDLSPGPIEVRTHMSSGVVISNHLFAFHGDAQQLSGLLKCVDLQTGVIRWATNYGVTVRTVGALIAADNKLIVVTGDGEVILAHASTNSFPIISRFRAVSSPPSPPPNCWTPPALVGNRLYVRSGNGLVRAFLLPVDAPPRLVIAARPGAVDLTWLTNATGFTLEQRPLPAGGADWVPMTNLPINDAGRFRVTVPPTGGQQLFRLKKP